ncbi:MAG: [citrate (pro-3S)-lyase] ligase [Bacilli bacterium]|nr:[citrate (pro-3S)-lyase] ligase [Bacilli bacterium]
MKFLVKEAILDIEKERVSKFLEKYDLEYEKNIDCTLYIEDNDEVIATISSSKYIIKDLAIASNYQGENLANYLISQLFSILSKRRIFYYQVFTKPENKKIFIDLNFQEIITVDNTCLLETKNFNIIDVLTRIKEEYKIVTTNNGVIVVNANPFTNGHLYLITEAAKNHSQVIVFVLEEDLSFFSFDERFYLVKEGTKHLKNVVVIPSTKYIISSLTFPTYFLKKDVDKVKEEAKVDANIFMKYFMPIFSISKRYVGAETDKVTARYNLALKEVLQDRLVEIRRKESNGAIISASLVREYYKRGEFIKIAPLVPPTTLKLLQEKIK